MTVVASSVFTWVDGAFSFCISHDVVSSKGNVVVIFDFKNLSIFIVAIYGVVRAAGYPDNRSNAR